MTEELQLESPFDFQESRSEFNHSSEQAPLSATSYVNKFTGEAVPSIALFDLPQAGGLRLFGQLNYSSNVKQTVYEENDKKQTSWVGLGWCLEFGRIITDDMMTVSENQRFWLDYNGLQEIVRDGDKYFLQGKLLWKVQPNFNTDGDLLSWDITTEDGLVYSYGSTENSKRILLTDGNRVLTTSHPLESNYVGKLVYCWDIASIKNPYRFPGRTIQFSYFQQNGAHPAPIEPMLRNYTQASYVEKIIDTYNREYRFILKERDQDEYLDPYQDRPENDCYQEIYDKYRLKIIEIYDCEDGNLRKQIIFSYDSKIGKGKRKKKLLTSITEINETKKVPPYMLSYVSESESKANKGALKSILYPSGGKVSFNYAKKNLKNAPLCKQIETDNNDILKVVGNSLIHIRILKETFKLFPGSDYRGTVNLEVYAFRWDGSGWQGDNKPIETFEAIPAQHPHEVLNPTFGLIVTPNKWKIWPSIGTDPESDIFNKSDESEFPAYIIDYIGEILKNIGFDTGTHKNIFNESRFLQASENFFVIRLTPKRAVLFSWNPERRNWDKSSETNISRGRIQIAVGTNFAVFLHDLRYSNEGNPQNAVITRWTWLGRRLKSETPFTLPIPAIPFNPQRLPSGCVPTFTLICNNNSLLSKINQNRCC